MCMPPCTAPVYCCVHLDASRVSSSSSSTFKLQTPLLLQNAAQLVYVAARGSQTAMFAVTGLGAEVWTLHSSSFIHCIYQSHTHTFLDARPDNFPPLLHSACIYMHADIYMHHDVCSVTVWWTLGQAGTNWMMPLEHRRSITPLASQRHCAASSSEFSGLTSPALTHNLPVNSRPEVHVVSGKILTPLMQTTRVQLLFQV